MSPMLAGTRLSVNFTYSTAVCAVALLSTTWAACRSYPLLARLDRAIRRAL